MLRRCRHAGLLAAFALLGCAAEAQYRPEPETPELQIEDRSGDAPPPPPTAPPADAATVGAAPGPEPSAPAAPSAPPVPNAPAFSSAPATPAIAAQREPEPAAPDEPPPPVAAAPPSSAHWAYEYPSGRWVYANGYGWMWVPADTVTRDTDGVPYAYLYTPGYGWNWYVSPWGGGVYHYGGWVRRPWRPVGFRGAWVAQPRVVVRLGAPPHRRYGRHRRHGW